MSVTATWRVQRKRIDSSVETQVFHSRCLEQARSAVRLHFGVVAPCTGEVHLQLYGSPRTGGELAENGTLR